MKRALLSAALTVALSTLSANATAENLLDVYQLARDNDQAFLAAEYQLAAVREGEALAGAALLPQVNLTANAAKNDSNDDSLGSYDSSGYSISLQQTLFNKKTNIQVDQADLSTAKGLADYQAAEQSLLLRVAKAYFTILRSEDNLRFARSEKKAIQQQLEQAERRFEVGLIAITDVKEAQASYDLSRAREIAAHNALSIAREELRLISSQMPTSLSPLQAETPLPAPQPANMQAWLDEAKNNNTDIINAEKSAALAYKDVEASRADHLPTFALTAGYNDNKSDGRQGDSMGGQIGIQMNIPIYSGGATSAKVRQSKSSAEAASRQLELTRRNVAQQVRNSYQNVLANISQVRAYKQALISTQVKAEATQAGFEVGTRTAVDVLNALRETYQAEANYAAARYDYILEGLTLKQASGTLSFDDLKAINQWLK